MTAQAERDFTFKPVEHWYEISEGGRVVARLFKTFHPALPYEVFMQGEQKAAKRCATIGEAAEFVRENC